MYLHIRNFLIIIIILDPIGTSGNLFKTLLLSPLKVVQLIRILPATRNTRLPRGGAEGVENSINMHRRPP
jgi:hypothetical protein